MCIYKYKKYLWVWWAVVVKCHGCKCYGTDMEVQGIVGEADDIDSVTQGGRAHLIYSCGSLTHI